MVPAVRVSLPQVIDSTIRSSYVSCHTKGYWSFGRKLGPTGASTDLIAGGAFARGLEILRIKFYGPEKLPLEQALEAGMMAAIEAYGDHQPADNKSQKGVDRVVHALAYYVEAFPPATDKIQPCYDTDGMPAVEFTFSVPLPILHPETGLPFLYAGRFDMKGLYNTQLVGVDEKTTSQLGPTWNNKWNMRGQFTGYVWALLTYGLPAVGMIVRGISFLKNGFGHSEAIQMRSQWQVDQWYQQLLADVENMKRAWENNWYDQNFDESCAEYGGCPFQRLCLSHNPENWIEGHYTTRDWGPLKKIPYIQPEAGQTEVVALPEGVQL